jgi:hypothetical protein
MDYTEPDFQFAYQLEVEQEPFCVVGICLTSLLPNGDYIVRKFYLYVDFDWCQ